MNIVNIFALGGQDEIGKNTYIIEVNESIYVVNTGIKRPINSKLGVDTLIVDYDYLIQNKQKIKGVFISSAKDENFAAIPWLLMQVPNLKIYSTGITPEIIKKRITKYNIGHNGYEVIKLSESTKIGQVNIVPLGVSSQMISGTGFNFQTPDGDVMFLSDFIIGDLGIFGKTDLEKIKNTISDKGLLALMLDSSRSNILDWSTKYLDIKKYFAELTENASPDSRIIVAAYDEDMATLYQIMQAAKEQGRAVVPFGRAFSEVLEEMKKTFNDLQLPKIEDYKNISKLKNVVILVTGTGERLYQRFMRIIDNNDVFLKLKESDIALFAAPPINGHEVLSSKTVNAVARRVNKIRDLTSLELHQFAPSQPEIMEILKELKPKYLFPIKGLYRYLEVARQIAIKNGMSGDKVVVMMNGKIAHFQDGELASISGKIRNINDVIVDGFAIGDVSYEVVREREKLAGNGVVLIHAYISRRTKEPLKPIMVELVGVAAKVQIKDVEDLVISNVLQILDDSKHSWDFREVQNRIRKKIQRVLNKKISKEPIVVVTFYEV